MSHHFDTVEALPPDAIFLTKTQFKNDQSKEKYNLGIGAYRTPEGKPYVLPIVHKVEQELANDDKLNKEYFPIGGNPEFIANAQKLILGSTEYDNISKNRGITGVQSLSGTGALRVLFEFVKMVAPNVTVWISNPTWGNHQKILKKAKLNFNYYPWWKPSTCALDFDGLINTLTNDASKGDVVLLHACAHNPTGVDPSKDQWHAICKLMKEKGLIPFFDSAYQGFATGSLENDAYAIRYFAKEGCEMIIAQSFAKNLGLYNERIGCASVVSNNKDASKAINSQLCAIVRPMYSNPPSHGARIVNKILNSNENYEIWNKQMKGMSQQIIDARLQLRWILENKHGLTQLSNNNNDESKDNIDNNDRTAWQHITDQIGMFCFSGLNEEQVNRLKIKHHIYMLKSGRISMAGVAPSDYFKVEFDNNGKLNKKEIDCSNNPNAVNGNVDYIGDAIAEVVQWAKTSKL